MMFLGILLTTAGFILLFGLIIAYAPWLMMVLCVGALLVCIWSITDNLID